jgi:hypothetical protein
MDCSDEILKSDFKVGIMGIPAEGRREHDLEIRSTFKFDVFHLEVFTKYIG